jgi:hypothetical protein
VTQLPDGRLKQVLLGLYDPNEEVSLLSMEHENIGPQGAELLAGGISACPTVTRVYLNETQIEASGARAIADAIVGSKTVTHVSFKGNDLGLEGAMYMAKVAEFCHVHGASRAP